MGNVECAYCYKRFYRKVSLERHVLHHLNLQPYKCLICNKGFTAMTKLHQHKIVHSTTKLYQCTKCGNHFKTKRIPLNRLKNHSKYANCPPCGKQLPSKIDIFQHIIAHLNNIVYTSVCNKVFTNTKNFKSHKMMHLNNFHDGYTKVENLSDKNLKEESSEHLIKNQIHKSHVKYHRNKLPSQELECNNKPLCTSQTRKQSSGYLDEPYKYYSKQKKEHKMKNCLKQGTKSNAIENRYKASKYSENLNKNYDLEERKLLQMLQKAYNLFKKSIDKSINQSNKKQFVKGHTFGKKLKNCKCQKAIEKNDNVILPQPIEQPHALLKAKKLLKDSTYFSKKRNVCSNKVSYYCSTCDKSFPKRSELAQHIKIHSERNQFGHNIFNKQFSEERNLEQLMDTHSSTEQYNVEVNAKRKLVSSNKENYQCLRCNRDFKRIHNLARHMSVHKKKIIHKCVHCSKSFTTIKCLLNHAVKHMCERYYQCLQCNKYFKTKKRLTEHVVIHSDRQPFQCLNCNMRFAQQSNLMKHKSRHLNKNDYQCSECGKQYKREKIFLNHVLKHLYKLRYKCLTCDEEYTSLIMFQAHKCFYFIVKTV